MARLIRQHRDGPIKIEPQDKPIWVCGCGLTRNFPFCDGNHKACAKEESGKLYVYDEEGNIVEEREDGD